MPDTRHIGWPPPPEDNRRFHDMLSSMRNVLLGPPINTSPMDWDPRTPSISQPRYSMLPSSPEEAGAGMLGLLPAPPALTVPQAERAIARWIDEARTMVQHPRWSPTQQEAWGKAAQAADDVSPFLMDVLAGDEQLVHQLRDFIWNPGYDAGYVKHWRLDETPGARAAYTSSRQAGGPLPPRGAYSHPFGESFTIGVDPMYVSKKLSPSYNVSASANNPTEQMRYLMEHELTGHAKHMYSTLGEHPAYDMYRANVDEMKNFIEQTQPFIGFDHDLTYYRDIPVETVAESTARLYALSKYGPEALANYLDTIGGEIVSSKAKIQNLFDELLNLRRDPFSRGREATTGRELQANRDLVKKLESHLSDIQTHRLLKPYLPKAKEW